MTINEAELDRLEGLYAAACPGEWCARMLMELTAEDSDFADAAHNAFPALLAAARALPAEIRAREEAEMSRDRLGLMVDRYRDRWHEALESATAAEQRVKALEEALAAEREACALIADEAWGEGPSALYDNGATSDGWNMACTHVTKAIRARSTLEDKSNG